MPTSLWKKQGTVGVPAPPSPPPEQSTLSKVGEGALKVAKAPLKVIDILTRPWNALVGAGTEGAKADKASTAKYGSAWAPSALKEEAQAVGKGLVRGIKGEQNYPLSGMIHELAPGVKSVRPLAWLMDSNNDMWAPRTPEQAAAYERVRQAYAKKHPTVTAVTESAKKTLENADLGDVLGLIGDVRGSANILPSIGGKKVQEVVKAVKGTGKKLAAPSEASVLQKAYEAAGEPVALLSAPADFVGVSKTVPVTRTFKMPKSVSEAVQYLKDTESEIKRQVLGMARTMANANKEMGIGVVSKQVRTLGGINPAIGGVAEEVRGAVPAYLRRKNGLSIDKAAQTLGFESADDLLRVLQNEATAKGSKKVSDFVSEAERVLTRMDPTFKALLDERERIRQANGILQFTDELGNPPGLREVLTQAAEHARAGRAAGTLEAPAGVKRIMQKVDTLAPMERTASTEVKSITPKLRDLLNQYRYAKNPQKMSLSRSGLGLQLRTGYREVPKGIEWMGKELVSGEKLKGVTDTVLGPIRNTPAYQTLAKNLARRFVPKDTPEESYLKAIDYLDEATNKTTAQSEEFARATGNQLAGISGEAQKLITHAVDQGVNLTDMAATERLIKDARLKLDVSRLDLPRLQKAAEYAVEQNARFAKEELKRGILQGVRDNYVSYIFDRNNPKAKAFLSRAMQRGQRISASHPFQLREFEGTLADAKRAGIPIKAESIGDILALRGQAHFRAVNHHDALQGLKGLGDLVVDESQTRLPKVTMQTLHNVWGKQGLDHNALHDLAAEVFDVESLSKLTQAEKAALYKAGLRGVKSPAQIRELMPRVAPEGWVLGEKVIPQFKGYKLHPELARFLNAELGNAIGNEDVRNLVRTFYDKPLSWWKTLVTRINPSFHARNAIDNAFKNYLADVDPQFAFPAAEIELGKAGVFVTKDGTQIPYDTIRQWGQQYGLDFTGQFGRAEDIGDMVKRILKESERSNVAKVFNYVNPGQLGRKAGNAIEGHAKMTHFLDRLYKYGDPQLAARSANRYLFNYGDLTPFEREIMRRVLPFYTFTRKNIPLMYQTALEKPGKFTALAVTKNALEQGKELPSPEEVPDYINEQYSIYLGRDANGKAIYFTPGISVSDFEKPFHPVDTLYSMASPFGRLPTELIHNRAWYGGEIDKYGGLQTKELPGYLQPLAAVPEVRDALGITEVTSDSGQTMYRIPAKVRYALDSLVGSAPRDLGKLFEQGTPEGFTPFVGSFVKSVDTEKQAQYNRIAERVRRINEAKARRDEQRAVEEAAQQDTGASTQQIPSGMGSIQSKSSPIRSDLAALQAKRKTIEADPSLSPEEKRRQVAEVTKQIISAMVQAQKASGQ